MLCRPYLGGCHPRRSHRGQGKRSHEVKLWVAVVCKPRDTRRLLHLQLAMACAKWALLCARLARVRHMHKLAFGAFAFRSAVPLVPCQQPMAFSSCATLGPVVLLQSEPKKPPQLLMPRSWSSLLN